MSVELKLSAEKRTDAGKGASRRLRKQKKVPAIIYGTGKEPTMVQVSVFELSKLMEREAFFSQIVNVDVEGKNEQTVLKDMQRHPFKDMVMHMDFMRIRANEKLTTSVPVHFLNEETCKGVKAGGVIHKDLIEIAINCLPRDIPEYLEVDLENLDVGDSVHLTQLDIPKGVELEAFAHGGDEHDHDQAVVSIVQPRAAKADDADEEDEGEAGEEAAGDDSASGDESDAGDEGDEGKE
ncbi:50S ribosomal protein L25/general stress protein Ctc [Aquisalimonas sp. 2447]|uniref:50S ribosomal protein L25/general stress protein Ctc n=1 Tax=Aquisalimonas sp. 2447 TaxID=2740807 RepID=UPI0014325517|nr:50S ribosomal protein L25/general stress protein Ctc [Aquisalimonas sp. 2447]QIT56428.1 50S ribosomal protein L25/general stress protein Ctc [Aquisalimonas sp. 2447]